VAVTLQQGWDFAIPMSPHCSAIFLQHSRSAEVMVAPGNTQAATGNAANISARAETPIFINSFNVTSLSTADSRTQQAGKGFIFPSYPIHVAARGNAGCGFQLCHGQERTESGLSTRQFEFKSFTIIVVGNRAGSHRKVAD
jgi:hypothetical protein